MLVRCRHCIEQSSLDGSHRQVVVDMLVNPTSLAVFGHHVYWVDRSLGKLLAFNYHGSMVPYEELAAFRCRPLLFVFVVSC